MKKRLFIALIIIALISLLIFNYANSKMIVYKMDVYNNDLRLTNFTLVAASDYCYIPDNSYIERIWEEQEMTDFTIAISLDGKRLTDAGFSFDHLTIVEAPNDILLRNIKINKDSQLTFNFKYKVNGVPKEFNEVVPLKKHIKQQ